MEKAIFYPFLMFIFAITMLGGWIPTFKLWSQDTFRLVISFCAGILLGAVFFHVLPEISTVLGSQLGYSVMFGFLLIFILEKFIMVHPCEEGECNYHKIGLAAYVGIGFHSILDGIAIGAGTMMNLSYVIIIAVTIHKFTAALALSGCQGCTGCSGEGHAGVEGFLRQGRSFGSDSGNQRLEVSDGPGIQGTIQGHGLWRWQPCGFLGCDPF
jgi:hypothetical protein